MKKLIYIFIFLFVIILSSCKTSPIEKQRLFLPDSVTNFNYSSINTSSDIKVYFPSFMTTDSKTHKTRMVQGDGTVVILPSNKVLIIDCFDPEGAEDLVSFLKDLGVTKIDYLISTHNHMDHFGSVPNLIQNFVIDHYYWNGVHFNTYTDYRVTEAVKNANIESTVLKQGDVLQIDENCEIDVLWPNLTDEDIYNAYYNPGRTERLKNNTSLVFKLKYGDFSILFTGDLYKQGDKIISKMYGSKLKSTILKAPHHGEFYTANSPSFIKIVNPEVSVILDNQYVKSFNAIITMRYKLAHSKLLYRNSAGYILINSDGKKYNIIQHSF